MTNINPNDGVNKINANIKKENKVNKNKEVVAQSKQVEASALNALNSYGKASINFKGNLKENEKDIKLKYDSNGKISQSIIKEKGKPTITKTYENGRLIESVSIEINNGIPNIKWTSYEYNQNGKIFKIKTNNENGESIKYFKYKDNGEYDGYELKKLTGETQYYNAQNILIGTKNDYSKEIADAVKKIEIPLNNEDLKTNMPIVRKTQILNRTNGQYENMYITSNNGKFFRICSIDGNPYGTLILKDSSKIKDLNAYGLNLCSDEYKKGNFLEIYSLKTNNRGTAKSPYKGLGTELVKQAIIESQKQGFNGRIALDAYNDESLGGDPSSVASNFYKKIGLSPIGTSSIFICPEYHISEFLTKDLEKTK